MFLKIITLIVTLFIGTLYSIGFIVDSVYLEGFGISYAEILGSPLDYLAIGGVYMLNKFTKYLTLICFALACISIFVIPAFRSIKANSKIYTKVKAYVDFKSVPYILASFSPFLIIWMLQVIPETNEQVKGVIEKSVTLNDEICIIGETECISGTILRYRDAKVIFYNSSTKKASIYPDSVLAKATHYLK